MGSQEVLLLTTDERLAASVATALRSNGHVLSRPAIRQPHDLLTELGRSSTAIVLVDIDPAPGQALTQLESVIARYPATRVVALSTAAPAELLMEAMQAGVRRVVLKQSVEAELQGVLNRLSASTAVSDVERGSVITVLSAGGGCGATTVAINLACELGLRRPGEPALIIDLDTAYASVSTSLGLEPRYGVEHVLSYDGPIDPSLISSTATAAIDGLQVLASPASVSFSAPEPLRLERIQRVLESTRQAYRNTVIDAPRLPMDVAAALASSSTATILAFQLVVKDIRTARLMLNALVERGVSLGTVVPLATRYVRRQMISLDEARKALGDVAVAVVRNDYASAIKGMNFGRTLAEAAPRSVLRKDIQDLAAKLVPAPAGQ